MFYSDDWRMTPRMRLQWGAALALVLVGELLGSEPPLDQCVKITGNEMRYSCNGGEYEITGTPFQYVNIECQDSSLECSRFPRIVFARNSTLRNVSVARCALREPLACFLRRLHVADAERLLLRELRAPLAARLLDGLSATTALLLYDRGSSSVQKSIPFAKIASLPHLKELRINRAQVTLAPDLLQGASALKFLELSSDAIAALPPRSFAGLPSLESLSLWKNRIADVDNDTFAGLEKVRRLSLNQNRLRELRGAALSPLRGLEELSVEKNPLARLRDGFLEGLDLLVNVTISSSESMVLDPRAFADLKSLSNLVLEECQLQELPSTVFQGSKAIRTLMLKDNRLERLHPEVFRDQTEMVKLDLSKNRLANISGDLFLTLKKLEELDLSYNRLEFFPDALFSALSRLRVLAAAHNALRRVAATAFQGAPLRTLLLAHNRLSFAPPDDAPEYYGLVSCPFNGLIALETLDLSHNLVDDVCEYWRLVMTRLRSLNLSHNRISGLLSPDFSFTGVHVTVDLSYNNISTIIPDPESFAPQNNLAKFILDHNPLTCDCQIYSFAKLATSSEYSQYFSLESARCNAPAQLEGTALTQVSLDEFVCQVKCPSVCNCTEVPNRGVVEAVCSEVGTEPSRLTDTVSLKFTREPKSLRNLPFKNVVEIDLNGLHSSEVDFENLPETVKVVNLSGNNLHYLPSDVLERNVSFALSNNPLFCDCWNQGHVAELQQHVGKIVDYAALRCEGGTLLGQVDVQRLCDVWKATVIGVSLTVFGVLCIMFAVLIYRYSFEVKIYVAKYLTCILPEEKYDASKKYDVFISYAHQDEDFVRDMLLPKLEAPPINLKTCIHSRDWIAGEMIPYNIAKSVEESRRTVIVLSENFLKSIWGLLEFRTAHVQATKEGRTRVVVILLEDVTNKEEMDKEIKAYLRTNTYIKWGEPWFWEKLAYALPKRGRIMDRGEEKRLQSIAQKLAKTGLDVQLNNDGKLVNAAFVKDL
ncbi:hypothetical protein K1T71_000843 [Dendrolimus kikuchii]|uniref:Uncharacterized protein n=1 Tax=Dendrolimus kikuchii TaxID=765133 RepID=A0ACC1DKP0_9NEOP|nr:hypothetical protein K1T71_000843 [Dendrolimus kikuchii]